MAASYESRIQELQSSLASVEAQRKAEAERSGAQVYIGMLSVFLLLLVFVSHMAAGAFAEGS